MKQALHIHSLFHEFHYNIAIDRAGLIRLTLSRFFSIFFFFKKYIASITATRTMNTKLASKTPMVTPWLVAKVDWLDIAEKIRIILVLKHF